MKNPWLDVPLADYEGHMALPGIEQAQLLADILAGTLEQFLPQSVAVLGCAGGNGFERIASGVTRVVGVDINPRFVAEAGARFGGRLKNLELIVGDIQDDEVSFEPVDLIFAGLVLEYVNVEVVVARTASMLTAAGRLVTVLQLPSESHGQVSAVAVFERSVSGGGHALGSAVAAAESGEGSRLHANGVPQGGIERRQVFSSASIQVGAGTAGMSFFRRNNGSSQERKPAPTHEHALWRVNCSTAATWTIGASTRSGKPVLSSSRAPRATRATHRRCAARCTTARDRFGSPADPCSVVCPDCFGRH